MGRTGIICGWVALALAGLASLSPLMAAPAQNPERIKLSSRVLQEQAVIGADGQPDVRRVPAQTLLPGSELIYEVSYANVGDRPAAELFIVNPLPSELRYRASIASSGNTRFEVSVDRARTWGDLSALRIKGSDGKPRPAEAQDITHVRWHVRQPLRPGEAGTVALRAVLR